MLPMTCKTLELKCFPCAKEFKKNIANKRSRGNTREKQSQHLFRRLSQHNLLLFVLWDEKLESVDLFSFQVTVSETFRNITSAPSLHSSIKLPLQQGALTALAHPPGVALFYFSLRTKGTFFFSSRGHGTLPCQSRICDWISARSSSGCFR